jgi:hypothetical protein
VVGEDGIGCIYATVSSETRRGTFRRRGLIDFRSCSISSVGRRDGIGRGWMEEELGGGWANESSHATHLCAVG